MRSWFGVSASLDNLAVLAPPFRAETLLPRIIRKSGYRLCQKTQCVDRADFETCADFQLLQWSYRLKPMNWRFWNCERPEIRLLFKSSGIQALELLEEEHPDSHIFKERHSFRSPLFPQINEVLSYMGSNFVSESRLLGKFGGTRRMSLSNSHCKRRNGTVIPKAIKQPTLVSESS
jgi:hypothetical protein